MPCAACLSLSLGSDSGPASAAGRLTGTLLGVKSIPSLPLSAEGQAHRLIREATDKDNLGAMYIWCAPVLPGLLASACLRHIEARLPVMCVHTAPVRTHARLANDWAKSRGVCERVFAWCWTGKPDAACFSLPGCLLHAAGLYAFAITRSLLWLASGLTLYAVG